MYKYYFELINMKCHNIIGLGKIIKNIIVSFLFE